MFLGFSAIETMLLAVIIADTHCIACCCMLPQAAFAARGRSHLGLALTLYSKVELAMGVQSVVHVLVSADYLCQCV
jgi:hypothetical protein